MLVGLHSDPSKEVCASDEARGRVRAKPRKSLLPFGGSLLPTGSPFGWSSRDRALYVQFLTVLLMTIITISFLGFDGWPFLLERPSDAAALKSTKALAVGALVIWMASYGATKRWYTNRGGEFSWLLFATVATHVVTGTSVCYAIGPYTAASGLITVAALLLGMVLLRRRWLWVAVVAWLVSMFAVHVASKAGLLPFLGLFETSLVPHDIVTFAAERAAAAVLISIPLAIVMDHLITVWRRDERTLSEAAQLDSLTGVYTRGFAMEVMERALVRAREDSRPLAVLMLDLDHFKRVNDAHGHARGDLVLKQTTLAMQATLRTDDILGRFGGEEFVVLLPGADLAQALGAAERCRAAVEQMKIPGAPYLSVTASVGVAAFPDHGTELDTLLKASDGAMYAAKAAGRNTIRPAQASESMRGRYE